MRIELENIGKAFGAVVAVEDVSFRIEEGELFFLLGPSGCGKTTLLRLIAGFISPDRGRILFEGKVINDVPPNRRNTGMVFQNYALWPHMTVGKNVEYGLRVRKVSPKERRRRVEEVLSLVRMSGYGNRYPGELSGGQQQRVALARVLVVRPDALLLDEPLSNLDAKLRVEMRDEIRRVHRETGITFVYVTHDQKEALSMADRIALMNEGKIVQVGTPHEIYSSPRCRFAATFLGRMNPIMGKVLRVSAEHVVMGTAVGDISAVKPEEKFVPGEAVECLVRPEAMRIASDDQPPESEENVLKGTVVDHSYLGETSEFQVKVADGTNVRVYVASSEAERIKQGEEVRVVFAAEDVVLCRASAASSGANDQSGAIPTS